MTTPVSACRAPMSRDDPPEPPPSQGSFLDELIHEAAAWYPGDDFVIEDSEETPDTHPIDRRRSTS
jgi:hypothetical protein